MLHCPFLHYLFKCSVYLCITVNAVLTEDMARIVMNIDFQPVFLGLFSICRAVENMVFVQRLETTVFSAKKAMRLIFLDYALQ